MSTNCSARAVALGAPMLVANFPRAYLDVNREPWELDPRMFAEPVPSFANIRSARVAGGLGTVPKLVGEGLDIYPGAAAARRGAGAHRDRLQALSRYAEAAADAHPCSASAMPCWSTATRCRPASAIGESGVRPDFIVGDRFGASAAPALTEHAIGLLISMGYTVAHNKPYAGGFITEHYGRPARGLHASRSRSIAAST